MSFSTVYKEHALGGAGIIPAPSRLRMEQSHKKKKILVISGPTAVGKSAISLRIADMMGGEIISADSMQVYRGMDIGTAKVSSQERARVPHYLIDFQDIDQTFNVAQFYTKAQEALRQIFAVGGLPIIVGGTGFYIHALIYGPPSGPPSVPEVRRKLEEEMDVIGPLVLYERLRVLDPEYAAKITSCDRHKIVRGLEIISITGLKVTEFTASSPEQTVDYDFRCWFLYRPLTSLYVRIEERCDEMLAKGLLNEVRELEKRGLRRNSSASLAIGYRQCLEFLDSAQTAEDWEKCVTAFKKASRQYARRQFTWFRREPLFRWLDVESMGEEEAAEMLAQDFELS